MIEYLPAIVAGVASLIGASGPLAVFLYRQRAQEKLSESNRRRIVQLEHEAIREGWSIGMVDS